MPKLITTKLYDLAPGFWTLMICSLISLSFILSDWIILYSSFGDFILALTAFVLLILGQFILTKKQIITMSIPILLVIVNFTVNTVVDDYWFDTTRGYRSSIKIILYVVTLMVFYNFLKRNQLMEQFLTISNIFAAALVIIGIGITVLIYVNRTELVNLVWTFTRTDTTSYLYNDNPNIVRTRSLFSEPAHLGYYLNTLFFANIFSKKNKNYLFLGLFTLGILLTLSYSMILIFLAINLTYFLTKCVKREFRWQRWHSFVLIALIVSMGIFWSFINTAIIQRTVDIITGTDGSAYNRIVESWIYVDHDRLIFGNGIAHSPPVTNIYAYFLSDFGFVGFIPYLLLTIYILLTNVTVFVLFILMNSAKGGYLNPAFWLFLLYLFIYCIQPVVKAKRTRHQLSK